MSAKAVFDAADTGDVATLKRLLESKVSVDIRDEVLLRWFVA